MIIKYEGQEVYKKQVEIARFCGVSEATVSNWIGKAKSEKNLNLLRIVLIKDRYFIVRSEHNSAELARLSKEAKDFQHFTYTQITPNEKIYDIMSEEKLLALVNIIKIHKTIPLKFVYLGEGAEHWDYFYNTLEKTEDIELKIFGIEIYNYLLNQAISFFDTYFEKFEKINLIDIGPGNSKPVFEVIKKLIDTDKLNKYVAVDISPEMIDIAKKTFCEKFPAKYFDSAIIDVEIESLQNLLFDYKKQDKVINLICILGSTFGNFELQDKVLQNTKEGMFTEDILIINNAFDYPKNRSIFPTIGKPIGDQLVLYIANLLGIEDKYFTKELWYNPQNKYREYNLIVKEPLQINFRNGYFVNLDIDDKLNVFRSKQDSFISVAQMIEQNNMHLQFLAKSDVEGLIIYAATVI